MELVVEDAVFVTMAEEAGSAGGMLIRDGRIADIGRAEAVRAAAPGAEVVRLRGATVIPGLIDAHCHVADIGYLAAAADCGQSGSPTSASWPPSSAGLPSTNPRASSETTDPAYFQIPGKGI